MDTIYDKFIEDIQQAEAVVVGVGKELSIDIEQIIVNSDLYSKLKESYTEQEYDLQWVKNCIYLYELNHDNVQIKEIIDTINIISKIVTNKNYFILTSNYDDTIYKTELKADKIAAPCGSVNRYQCEEVCNDDTTDNMSDLANEVADIIRKGEKSDLLFSPKCSKCNNKMVPNVLSAHKYLEAGYMPQWEKYTKWLQFTINRKVVILELGEGFKAPTVMRWPFERITFINQKARFYRVNEQFAQITQEISERAESVSINSIEFLNIVNRKL